MGRIVRELQKILGKESVLSEEGDLAAFAADAKVRGHQPRAVALPADTGQVQNVVRLCADHRLPLVPRGAGTGVVGGAVPEGPAVVLDLSRMNKLLHIDQDGQLADAQAGMVTGEFQQAVEKVGLFYPPDPASNATSTLGGNAATGAGGLRAVKYGVTADWVQGLEVVLANGQVIHTGVRTRKGVVGYSLTHLFIGSEGTLGIITGLTLRLIPKPPAKTTMLALFDTLPAAGNAVMSLLRSPVKPAALELMDATAIDAIRGKIGDLIPAGVSTVLLDLDGTEKQVKEEARIVEKVLEEANAQTVRVAEKEEDAKTLWAARRAISPALYELRSHKVAEDVAVPVYRIVDLFEGVARIAEEHELLHACYGHAGDGNVHVNLLYDPQDKDETARAGRAREDVFRLALELGGTLSGEHGVGISKRPYIQWEQGPALLDLQRRLKRAFDPLNILNPGKVFP